MIKTANYNFRVGELIKSGYSDSEISKSIYTEYGIRLSEVIIKSKRKGKFLEILKEEEQMIQDSEVLLIKEALRCNPQPMKAREISKWIQAEKGVRISKQEINKKLYRALKKEIYYDRRLFTYSLKSERSSKKEEKISKKGGQIQDELTDFFVRATSEEILREFRNFFKSKHLTVDSGKPALDEIIKTVVKDNRITRCEEEFLKQKTKELDLSYNLLEKAKRSLHSNNPYLDNILDLIFEDGIITEEELKFLKEKTEENNFSKGFVNKRFWVHGVTKFLPSFLVFEDFQKIIKLWYVGSKINDSLYRNDIWFSTRLDIFQESDFAKVLSKSLSEIENEFCLVCKQKQNRTGEINIPFVYDNIKIKPIAANIERVNGKGSLDLEQIMKILDAEKIRIGSPDVNLLVENVKFRIENDLWV